MSSGRRLGIRIGLGLVLALTLLGLWLQRTLYFDQGVAGAPIHLVVPEGASLIRVARELEAEGAIAAGWQLRLVSRLEGGSRSIHAGEYEIPAGSSPATILKILVEGRVLTQSVTLIEGWTARKATAELARGLGLEREELAALISSPSAALRERFDIPAGHGLEGYLLPETYLFASGTSAETVIQSITGSLYAALDDSVRARMEEIGFSLHELLTLASIVEAEAVRDDERASIAAVYHNRLRKGWKLEADPTVAFATDKVGERLTYRDLEVDSPYNTYRVRGLPPGPINSPGWASVIATLWPRVGFDAMYFVADGSGGHRFSRTWDEHSAAVREYRKLMRQRRANGSG